MTLNVPSPGHGAVSEYQVSGVPFITSSTVLSGGTLGIALPYVCRDFKVRNLGPSNLQIGVSALGAQTTNFFLLPVGQSELFTVRTTTIFITNPTATATSCSLAVGMTMISSASFPILTGANNFPGVG